MKLRFVLSLAVFVIHCGTLVAGPFDIVPVPVSVKKGEGSFHIRSSTEIRYAPGGEEAAKYAAGGLKQFFGLTVKTTPWNPGEITNCILLHINQPIDRIQGTEGYLLKITPEMVKLSANTSAGLFYGIQTIGQMLSGGDGNTLPAAVILDYPRFSYRGMHLDVSRHFMPIEFIYQMIDYMAMHKLNVFHWHLVDDQGWRLEIKKYPGLTETGAWRVDREVLHWNNRPAGRPGEKATYGGFYTQEDAQALVRYAQSRCITVIPEIEMPAHVMSALAAYPELSCTGQNLGVPPGGVWPITHIYCAGKEETFEFVENILEEVMAIFPSDMIHVGGDEANKAEWEKCPLCQKRIQDEGLKNEHELQSYFIRRIERFLNKHGRKLIGWDEILEGGLAPDAAVMSWRGEAGGISAAKMGHQVVMTPSSHCYFDYYQGDPSVEPRAIGGYLTLKKVYSYEPVPAELNDNQAELILGAQANIWTEYISTPGHAEYMIFPRLAALAEVVWSPKQNRDWNDFTLRMERQFDRYKKLGINFAKSSFRVTASPKLIPESGIIELELSAEISDPEIRYTLDGSDPTGTSALYEKPLAIDHSVIIKAAVFRNGRPLTSPTFQEYCIHQAIASPVTLKYPASGRSGSKSEFTLTDGIRGSVNFNDGKWKGFSGVDMVAVIDLGKATNVNSLEADALQDATILAFLPKEVIFEGSSDGKKFRILGRVKHNEVVNPSGKIIKLFTLEKQAEKVRFIRVTAKNQGVCPPGYAGEGMKANLYVSEIAVK
jgi:hexosaminidase